ncbi:MAG: hypothetical protein CSA66_01300 [Proteobacteria bacterium]|nr:MAG: hypothetical protein CSA66_01300 [Pseudomonadota bacterium]
MVASLPARLLPSLAVAASLAAPLGCASGGSASVDVTQRRVEVDVLWFGQDAAGFHGGMTPTEVRLEPNDTDRIRVGIFEGASLQAGAAWRAAIWLATLQAAMELGVDPARWVVAVETESLDRIDGPSAGGLLTAAIMAAMTDAPARPEASMTGTINPDGTIGPVGGIPQKLEGAIAAGKTALGYPMGQRRADDLATGEVVDLERRFASDAVRLEEVRDVRQAYALLTGREAPPQPTVTRAEMALPRRVEDALTAQARSWLGAARLSRQEYDALGGPADAWIDARWEATADDRRAVESLVIAGEAAPAYWRAARLSVNARSLGILGTLRKLAAAGDYAGIERFSAGLSGKLERRLHKTVEALEAAGDSTPDDLVTLVDGLEAFGAAIQSLDDALRHQRDNALALGMLVGGLSTGELAATPERHGHLVDLMFGLLSPIAIAEVNATIATQNLGFRAAGGGGRGVPGEQLGRIVALLGVAAKANLTYFETTTLAEVARHHGVSVERVQAAFQDVSYRHARKDPRAFEAILAKHLAEDSRVLQAMKLAAAFSAYVATAVLIAKYYSLGFETDVAGAVTGVRRMSALDAMLERAEVKARAHAARARAITGAVPIASRIAYQIGRASHAEGGLDDKVEALEQYWRSSLLSMLVAIGEGGTRRSPGEGAGLAPARP